MTDLDPDEAGTAAGDREAFACWLARSEVALRSSLRSFAAGVDAEAVLQEALLRVWQVAPRVRPDGRPRPLLRLGVRIARNLALMELRRLRCDPLADCDSLADETPPPDPLLRERIRRCRDRLPARAAQVLAARLDSGGGEPDRALAERLGMRLNTFLRNFGRARQLLATCLRRSGVELP